MERGGALHKAKMVEELQWGEEPEKMDKRASSQILCTQHGEQSEISYNPGKEAMVEERKSAGQKDLWL